VSHSKRRTLVGFNDDKLDGDFTTRRAAVYVIIESEKDCGGARNVAVVRRVGNRIRLQPVLCMVHHSLNADW
jgi:hypothetical protein